MKYDALTIDTQVIMAGGFDFDGGLLAQLKQFKDGQTEVLVSEIVFREILRHLRQNTTGAKAAIESAQRKVKLYGFPAEACVGFTTDIDTDALARSRLQKYLEEIGATLIRPDDVAMRDLVQTYFSASPPSPRVGTKRTNFQMPYVSCRSSIGRRRTRSAFWPSAMTAIGRPLASSRNTSM